MPSSCRNKCTNPRAFYETLPSRLTGSDIEIKADIVQEHICNINTINILYVKPRSPKDKTSIIFAFFFLGKKNVLILVSGWDFTASQGS